MDISIAYPEGKMPPDWRMIKRLFINNDEQGFFKYEKNLSLNPSNDYNIIRLSNLSAESYAHLYKLAEQAVESGKQQKNTLEAPPNIADSYALIAENLKVLASRGYPISIKNNKEDGIEILFGGDIDDSVAKDFNDILGAVPALENHSEAYRYPSAFTFGSEFIFGAMTVNGQNSPSPHKFSFTNMSDEAYDMIYGMVETIAKKDGVKVDNLLSPHARVKNPLPNAIKKPLSALLGNEGTAVTVHRDSSGEVFNLYINNPQGASRDSGLHDVFYVFKDAWHEMDKGDVLGEFKSFRLNNLSRHEALGVLQVAKYAGAEIENANLVTPDAEVTGKNSCATSSGRIR